MLHYNSIENCQSAKSHISSTRGFLHWAAIVLSFYGLSNGAYGSSKFWIKMTVFAKCKNTAWAKTCSYCRRRHYFTYLHRQWCKNCTFTTNMAYSTESNQMWLRQHYWTWQHFILAVGWVAQWSNVGLWPANFHRSAADLQLMSNHLYG